ncbi:MAG: amidase family protein [Vicinamibacterales bacterium]
MKRVALVLLALSVLTFPLAAEKPADGPRSRLQLVEATIYELQHALRTGLVTSEQLVQMYLARIAAYDDAGPGVNAFIHINETALDEARERDAERRRGHKTHPLFGIPVLLKDNIDTADMPTTAGSVALEGSIPPDDAFIAQKLRDVGAIILGKATLTEFANFIAIGMPSGYSSLGGYGFNPYDPRPLPVSDGRPVLTPGGSSSGSGIAVAANLVAVAVGTETSGSILSPGTANMDVGIKPTLGLVSRDGILPITADQDTAGPLTRTVYDAAVLLGTLAGFDAADPATAACLTPGNCFDDYTRFLNRHALRGARIAVPRVPYWNGFSTEQTQIMLNAIEALRSEGAFVADPYEIPNQAAITAFGICVSYPPPVTCSSVLMYGQKKDLNAYLAARQPAPVQTLADIIAFNIAFGPGALKYGQAIFLAADQLDVSPGSADTARYLADRAQDLALTRTGLDAVFNGPDGIEGTADDFDAILFPRNGGAGAPAKAGYPSIVVPGGFTPPVGAVVNPIPFGVTFSGPAFSEPKLLAIAYAFEQATKHRVPPESTPPLPSDLVRR